MSTINICKETELSNCERTATGVISDYYTSKQPQFGGYVIIWWHNFTNTLNLRQNSHHWHFLCNLTRCWNNPEPEVIQP